MRDDASRRYRITIASFWRAARERVSRSPAGQLRRVHLLARQQCRRALRRSARSDDQRDARSRISRRRRSSSRSSPCSKRRRAATSPPRSGSCSIRCSSSCACASSKRRRAEPDHPAVSVRSDALPSTARVTFLGTGTSHGVPMIGCACATCHSTDPRDRRLRPSIYLEVDDGPAVLVDTAHRSAPAGADARRRRASTPSSSRTATPTTSWGWTRSGGST